MTLKGYPLENLTLKDRKMIKQRSTENILQPNTGNFYVSKPIDSTIRDEPDPPPLCHPTPPDSRRESQISIERSQSTLEVNMVSTRKLFILIMPLAVHVTLVSNYLIIKCFCTNYVYLFCVLGNSLLQLATKQPRSRGIEPTSAKSINWRYVCTYCIYLTFHRLVFHGFIVSGLTFVYTMCIRPLVSKPLWMATDQKSIRPYKN